MASQAQREAGERTGSECEVVRHAASCCSCAQDVVLDLSEKVELMSSQIKESQAACARSSCKPALDHQEEPCKTYCRYVQVVQREEVLKEKVAKP